MDRPKKYYVPAHSLYVSASHEAMMSIRKDRGSPTVFLAQAKR